MKKPWCLQPTQNNFVQPTESDDKKNLAHTLVNSLLNLFHTGGFLIRNKKPGKIWLFTKSPRWNYEAPWVTKTGVFLCTCLCQTNICSLPASIFSYLNEEIVSKCKWTYLQFVSIIISWRKSFHYNYSVNVFIV